MIDREELAEAMAGGDLRVLLMCLVHLTGDLTWLDPPFRPRRDVRLVADPRAGLDDAVAAQIRAAVVDVVGAQLAKGRVPEAVLHDPGNELMVRMMSTCLGEPVPPEYAPMMREDLGLVSRDVGLEVPADVATPTVLIVGAGVSGIALGAQLGRLGVPYTIVERNADVGGTWFENRYPGCGVDTPNHAYSFSHGRRNRWSRFFSLRDEIQDYLERCADEFDVREHVRFSTQVQRGDWDEGARCWRVVLRLPNGSSQEVTAGVLVSAVGALNVPRLAAIPGIDDFAGPLFHSARWPADIDLTGTHVAIVGTGASSMQLAPSIAATAASITIYQRSPHWARNIDGYRANIPDGSLWLLEHLPYYAEWFRFTMFWRYGDGLLPLLRKDPEWPHPERSVNRINDRHRQEMTDFIAAELDGRADLLDKCLPDYPPFGKRILLDNGWYRMLREPHVELVTDPIERITTDGITTTDDRHRRADVVVMATGFHTKQLAAHLHLHGRDGVALADAWSPDNPTAYLGLTVPGFPNLFCMLGPNTGLGHGGSAIFQSECQARYITATVLQMAAAGVGALDVRREVHDEFVRRVDAEHEQLIWTHPGMTNWYRNDLGRVVSLLPWRLVDYWAMTHDPDLADYRLTSMADCRA